MNTDDITLICIDCVNLKRAIRCLNISTQNFPLKNVKILTSLSDVYEHNYEFVKIQPINSIVEYVYFIYNDLHRYFDTSHVLLIQHDGFVINPHAWNDNFLSYDYVGCVSLWTGADKDDIGGNGGFSIRSKEILKYTSNNIDIIKKDKDHLNEDYYFSKKISQFNIAPRSVELEFGVEIWKNWENEFGFHNYNMTDMRKWENYDKFISTNWQMPILKNNLIKQATYGKYDKQVDCTRWIIERQKNVVFNNNNEIDRAVGDPLFGTEKDVTIYYYDGNVLTYRPGQLIFSST